MPTYVAFLRAINLGPRRRVSMEELVACLEDAGFEGVVTHLATGNVRVRSRRRTAEGVAQAIEAALHERFGFEVPAVVLTLEELHRVVEEAEAVAPDAERQYVTLLKEPPAEGARHELDSWSTPGEGAMVGHRAVHWWADHDFRAGRLSNAVVEKQLGVATTRTVAVVRTVRDKWGAEE